MHWVLFDTSELSLNLVRVDNSCKISAGHHTSIKLVARLLDTLLTVSTEHLVKVLEGILGEDAESSKMTTWSQLENVESVNVANVNSWQVSCSLLHILGGVGVNDEWSFSHDVSGITVFDLS